MNIDALKGKKFDSVTELLKALFEIANDDKHPEQDRAKEYLNKIIGAWGNYVKGQGFNISIPN